MQEFTIIKDIVIILLVSLPIIFLLNRVKLPSILGFLVAGIIIGPYGFELISNLKEINLMAEIGVILLLFTIGLEVSLDKLLRMRKVLFYAGILQILITIVITASIFYFFDVKIKYAIFLGMLASLSSTAIVLKLLSDRNELESPQGRLSLMILILQDLAIVPMLILLPILGGESNYTPGRIVLQLFYAFGAVALIILISKFLMPKVIFQLAKLKIREAFTIGTILLLLGTAYLTHYLGLSFAIGAFIAGLILSESDYSHQITSDIIPLKDVFNSIFFVSIGLLLNIQFVYNNFLLLISITAAIIILKSSIIFIIIKILNYPVRVAVITGVGLAQVGEFSFVLSQGGLNFNLINPEFYNAFLSSSIFTMLLTPFLINIAPAIGFKVNRISIPKDKEQQRHKLEDHVIIVGYGLNGKNLARVLKETGIEFIVIEMNAETVKKEKEKGKRIIFGDASHELILKTAGIERASIIVFAISDPAASKRGLQTAKKLNPGIYTIVRTRFNSEINELKIYGADEVIPEEFETSLQIFSKVLEKYHIPLNVIMKQTAILRGESYGLMRKEDEIVNPFINLNEILAAGLTETYFVTDDNIHLGKTISELNLRALTETTIIAIVRGEKNITGPGGKEKILQNDTLVITGTHKSVDRAINFLNGIEEKK